MLRLNADVLSASAWHLMYTLYSVLNKGQPRCSWTQECPGYTQGTLLQLRPPCQGAFLAGEKHTHGDKRQKTCIESKRNFPNCETSCSDISYWMHYRPIFDHNVHILS